MAETTAAPTAHPTLPVAVLGAGPIGLAAAAGLAARGETPLLLEAGDAVASAIRAWGHVRLFSPWKYLVDEPSRRLLEETGWTLPDPDELPTGRELVERYLEPLAATPAVARALRLGHRVVAVSRRGFDKVKSAGREEAPFELLVETAGGATVRLLARAVIDATGTWSGPNPLGASGLPVPGERALAGRIAYGVPDALGAARERYAGRRVLVLGSGHSAFNAVLDLAALAAEEPGTEVVWAIRRAEIGLMFGGGRRDALPARGSLGERLRRLVESGAVRLERGFRAERLVETDDGVRVEGEGGVALGPFDELVAVTGFRPDLAMTRELRLALDPWLESPVQLAPLVDPNVHSCGTVYPHGAAELAHPEKGYYAVGMKSYGRAPTFLMLTGYEQVRSVVAALTGDERGAREVRLVLPETGVCSTDLAGAGKACCGSGDARAVAGALAGASEATPAPIGGSCGIASACASPAAVAAASAGAGAEAAAGCCG